MGVLTLVLIISVSVWLSECGGLWRKNTDYVGLLLALRVLEESWERTKREEQERWIFRTLDKFWTEPMMNTNILKIPWRSWRTEGAKNDKLGSLNSIISFINSEPGTNVRLFFAFTFHSKRIFSYEVSSSIIHNVALSECHWTKLSLTLIFIFNGPNWLK